MVGVEDIEVKLILLSAWFVGLNLQFHQLEHGSTYCILFQITETIDSKGPA